MLKQFLENSYLFGGNAPYVEELYEKYLDNGTPPDPVLDEDDYFTIAFGASAAVLLPRGASLDWRLDWLPAVDDFTGECANCDEVVALAASVERASEHPVAHAIVAAASVRRLQHRYPLASAVTAHAGRGVSGELATACASRWAATRCSPAPPPATARWPAAPPARARPATP